MQANRADREAKTPKWSNVLLTDAGFYNPFDLKQPLGAIIDRFSVMVGKPFSEAKVLFIPAAACDDEAKQIARILKRELLWMGFPKEHITEYNLETEISLDDALSYDVMYFTGGWDEHLIKAIKRINFDGIVRQFVFANKVYVGMSAGSVVATPNTKGCFGDWNNSETAALGLVNAYIDVHCDMKPDLKPLSLPLPHIMLYMNQALAVSSVGYELIEETAARYHFSKEKPPIIFEDVFNDRDFPGFDDEG